MENPKMKILLLVLLMTCIIDSKAQDKQSDKKASQKLNLYNPIFYVGGGRTTPGTEVEAQTHCTSFIGFNLGIFLPAMGIGKIVTGKEKFSLGLYLGNEFFFSNKYQFNELPLPYNISGHSTPSIIVSNDPFQIGFKFNGGLQFNFLMAKHFVISPMLGFGTFIIQQQAYEVVQTTSANLGNPPDVSYTLMKMQMETIYPHFNPIDENAGKGHRSFFLSPKIRLHYDFNSKVGLWVEANYLYGPKANYVETVFYPQGKPDQNGEYSMSQMDAGMHIDYLKTFRYSSVGLNFGIAYALQKR